LKHFITQALMIKVPERFTTGGKRTGTRFAIAHQKRTVIQGVSIGIFLVLFVPSLCGQQKVSFYTEDSLKVTADLYLEDYSQPFVLLFHQAEGSRGEYSEVAPRLQKLQYNCLVVDMRVGSKMNYISNETAQKARETNKPRNLLDADQEIGAAMQFVQRYNTKDVVLVGSSFSASLCLMRASKTNSIKAVIAFSPGEYFRPARIVKDQLQALDVPVFISANNSEIKFIEQLMQDVPSSLVHYFTPGTKQGAHGAKMLWDSTEASDACWFDLLLFFKKIRYE